LASSGYDIIGELRCKSSNRPSFRSRLLHQAVAAVAAAAAAAAVPAAVVRTLTTTTSEPCPRKLCSGPRTFYMISTSRYAPSLEQGWNMPITDVFWWERIVGACCQ